MKGPTMLFGDTSRVGQPFAKDPSVVSYADRYLLYYTLPPYPPEKILPGAAQGYAIGIAESHDLDHWEKIGELTGLPETAEENGICAPGARVLDGKVHLFYQTYGNGPRDAICHAVSDDGVAFTRDATNPVFHPTGAWCAGRAIDAEVFEHDHKLFLYYATRDPGMRIQMLGVASADRNSDFGRAAWTALSLSGPLLKPELAWEQDCIEAATVCRHDNTLFLFYGGAYNAAPQQIGVASSQDAIHWTRLGDTPFLPNGAPGTWNAHESGHPGVFVDGDGKTHLFYQGTNDKGKTWQLSRVELGWHDNKPFVKIRS